MFFSFLNITIGCKTDIDTGLPDLDPSLSGLPILYINTENNEIIFSKEKYLNATLSLKSDNEDYCINNIDIQIAGRGNSTWNNKKKPYKFKVVKSTEDSKKQNFFDISSGKQKS